MNKSFQKGVTLIEALAAIVLLALAIIPLMVVGSESTNVASSIRNNIIAANLAQEGAEVIRAIRDTNWLATPVRSFDSGLSPQGTVPFDCTVSCRVEWKSTSLLAASAVPLKVTSSGIYTYTGRGTSSLFFRNITITRPSSVELKVISEVTWKERARTRKITIEDHLFDWK
jgi:Tfp pilus assembly protein PilV